MTRPALAMLIALLLAACHGGSEAPPAASEGSAAATSTHDGEGSAEGAPARDMAAAAGSGALPEGVVDHAPPAGFDPATQLVGSWTFDEERTRNSLSIELAAQLPAGMDATMTFDAPEGSGAGAYNMRWIVPGHPRTDPEPGTWEVLEVDADARRAHVRTSYVRVDEGGVVNTIDADVMLPPDGTMHFVDRQFPGLVMIWKKVPAP